MTQHRGHTKCSVQKQNCMKLNWNNILLSQIDLQSPSKVKSLANPKSACLVGELICLYLLRFFLCNSNCVLFCTFLFGNQDAPKAFAGLGTRVDRGGTGRSRFSNNRKQFPNLKLAERLAIPTTLMWRLEASYTDGLGWTQVFFILLRDGQQPPHCLPVSSTYMEDLHGRGLDRRPGKWVGYCWRWQQEVEVPFPTF